MLSYEHCFCNLFQIKSEGEGEIVFSYVPSQK